MASITPVDINSIKYGDYSKLSRLVGVSAVHVRRILVGASSPTMPTAIKLAGALGMSVEELYAALPVQPPVFYDR